MLTGSKKISLEPIDIKYHRFKGVGIIYKILKEFDRKKEILVYFDPDIDGLISGFFVCRFLASQGYKFKWYINKNRDHGFMIPVERLNSENIIAVDFLISPETLKSIVDSGNNIISMDHHVNVADFIRYENGENGTKGVIVNNQYPFEEESSRYLSGAGVVFEVFRTLDKDFDTKENRALVGLTLLTDVRDIENINARGYLTDLYTHKYKGYIGYLLNSTIGDIDYGFGVPRLDRNYVDFTFSPLINSCLRFNKETMVVNFILGRSKLDKSYLQKQRELVPILIEKSLRVDYGSLYVAKIDSLVLTDEEREVASNFIGLVASRNLDDAHSCICYISDETGNVKRASFRGHINSVNYLDELNRERLLHGVGHEPAFGIKDLKPSDALFKEVSRRCKSIDVDVRVNIQYVNNMSMFVGVKGYNLGLQNIFCLSQNRVYIRYTGSNIVKKRSGAKYVEYSIDGISVMCFDSSLDPRKDLILPILEREVLCLYLNRKDSSDFFFDD